MMPLEMSLIPEPSLDLRPIVSGFSSGSSKLPFYYCGTGAHGSWTGHEKTTFCGCISEDRESESVFGLPFWDSVLEEDRNENLDPQANTAARSTATQPRAMRKNVSDKTGHIPL